MDRKLEPGRGRSRGEGISEVIGFLLILAVVITSISIYLLYVMPAMGREAEIAKMNEVKEAFTEYKLNIDTLWTSRQCTSDFGPALSIGSGEKAGILSYFPFFNPPKSSAVLALNQRAENITISSDSYYAVSSGGYNESRSLTSTPWTVNVNSTPVNFYINLSTTDLLTKRGVLFDTPERDVWVNITPNYFPQSRFSWTTDVNNNVTSFTNSIVYVLNSTDITVTTFAGGSPDSGILPVYRNIIGSKEYRVDLMNPVYGVSTLLATPRSVNLSLSDNSGAITGSYDIRYGYVPMVNTTVFPLGSIEYRSNNIYYTPQTYYYQLGGVFLEQEDGSTNEIPPAISISYVNGSTLVSIGDIQIQSGVTSTNVSGSGPITVASAVTDATTTSFSAGNNTKWVNITIQAASTNAARMWQKTLTSIADQGGLPVSAYTNGTSGNYAFINITGNPQLYDIRYSRTQVNLSADYVDEYSAGEVSRYWRNVPGFILPGSSSSSSSGLEATTTTLGSSTTSSYLGDLVTFTATVTGSVPNGTVTFYNGSISLGTITLSSGVAVLSLSTLPVGINPVIAQYNGNSYFQASSSNTVQVTVSSGTPPAGYVPWYDCAWTHRKNITIDKRMVNGTLTDFPALINFTSDSDLKTYAKANGQDILFTDSGGTSKLSHEIELYQSGSGGLVAWVKIPQIQNTANTTIYMYYGNSAATPQWQNTSVWSNGYAAVWHLSEPSNAAANGYKDSSGNGNHGWGGAGDIAKAPNQGYGKFGYGGDFVSTGSEFIQIPDTTGTLQISGPITIEAWMKGDTWTDPGGGYRSIIGRQYGTGVSDSYQMAVYADGSNPSTIFTFFTTGNVGAGTVSTNTWYFFAMNFTPAGTSTAYHHLNGAWTGSNPGIVISIDGNPVIIGGEENDATSQPTQLFDGIIDEVRLSNVARSFGWIWTEYNNQNSPTTFAYRMPQESGSCAPAFVQAAGSDSYVGNVGTITLPGPSTAGNLIVLGINIDSTSITVSSVTDSKSNMYTPALGPTDWQPTERSWTYYASNIAGGGGAITITVTYSSPPPTYSELYAAEYSGVATASPVDQTSAQFGDSATLDSGAKTTTQASELIFGFGMSAGTCTVDAPYTARNTLNNNFIADRTVSSTGSYHVTGTQVMNWWMCHMVTFKGK
jgi:hypothetical protein